MKSNKLCQQRSRRQVFTLTAFLAFTYYEIKMKAKPFDKYWNEYDRWYDEHEPAYKAELNAVKDLIPDGRGLEIGVGTGRFAMPFQVRFGLDPSLNMLLAAKKRGIRVVQSIGENLPFKNDSFHFILIVVTLCFLDDVLKVIQESIRTLKHNGYLITGMINKNSLLGIEYQKTKKKNPFYRLARFMPPEKILRMFHETGLQFIDSRQALFRAWHKSDKDETPKIGYNQGGFVVLKAQKI
ncbi:MAG: methyltransferase domain-containing protein [Candidatus Aminicenantes bacterium]|nr:methyltransferase domain-containing protein [Candidatus Aminicenantes bacterium]